ncbi:hypothetical protein [Cognataquiflexum rubidum]|uniref:hypothetical protein n=1 Tax=Cognataquiflexum rubidum TaxID=2922273 RepID=UPI001F129207|nr:hypothetical protein [Cognataquiflexum rubidum]MCH6234395.1 hypothetical protein [Cognataquiflexum rubidum]
MKIIPVLSKVLMGSAFVLFLSYCTKPIEEKLDDAETKVQEKQSEVIEAKGELYDVAADSVGQVEEYLVVTKQRLEANTKNLEEIKRELKSDRAFLTPILEQELSDLDKRNKELLKIANDTSAIRSGTWENVKIEFNKEMDALETAITDFRDKGTKKP